MNKLKLLLVSVVLLNACDNVAEKTFTPPASTLAPSPAGGWVGRWVGVEGLHLTVEKEEAAGEGHYLLTMQYGVDASDSGTFHGKATDKGIVFTRPDGEHLLRVGNGEATGLKWLANKQNCLLVQPGEGYCR